MTAFVQSFLSKNTCHLCLKKTSGRLLTYKVVYMQINELKKMLCGLFYDAEERASSLFVE